MKLPIERPDARIDPYWQRSRIAARIILKSRKKPLHEREKKLAAWLAEQKGVSNRLIQQGVYSVPAPMRITRYGTFFKWGMEPQD
jgi:hypothetical protein